MTNQGNIPDETWAEALRWGRLTNTPEEEIVGALVHRAIHAAHSIPVQPAAAWMRKSPRLRSGGPSIAVTALNGRGWDALDERLRALPLARRILGPTPRAWYRLPYTHLDAIRTLFADQPDRVRVCLIDAEVR